MTQRPLPPFSAIRAFEAAARHLSFKGAAEELCVTPSAISHQVRTLEDHLGQPVFVRAANRLALTRAGEAYAGALSGIITALVAATDGAMAGASAGPFRVQATAAFNARWLVPRLERCPLREALSVTTAAGAPDTDFASNDADLIVHWCDSPIPGCHVLPMLKSVRFPVASPEVAARIRRPRDLLNEPLLRDQVLDCWADWFRAAGVAAPEEGLGGRFNANCDINLTAAERGQGVALAWDAIARATLVEGRLVRLFDIETAPKVIYSVAYPEARADDPRIAAMRDWLLLESMEDGTGADPVRIEAAQ
ncbi:MAG: LysR family transcriptional regulator [Roseovarius sp.]|uniref:LysR family transcriptional regulator n=1 Tax=Roseovarius sp. TaxID=1486281 RepID=UPI0032EE0A10